MNGIVAQNSSATLSWNLILGTTFIFLVPKLGFGSATLISKIVEFWIFFFGGWSATVRRGEGNQSRNLHQGYKGLKTGFKISGAYDLSATLKIRVAPWFHSAAKGPILAALIAYHSQYPYGLRASGSKNFGTRAAVRLNRPVSAQP